MATFEEWRDKVGLEYDEVLEPRYFKREIEKPKPKLEYPLPSWRLLAAIFNYLKEAKEGNRTLSAKAIAEELGVSSRAIVKHLRLAQWAQKYPRVRQVKNSWILEGS